MIGDGLREWALTVCAASVFCAAVSILAPDEKYEKVINLSLTALMLLIIVSPLRGLQLPDIELSSPKQETVELQGMEDLITEQAAERIAHAAELILTQKLAEQEISAAGISVSTDISGNGCISIGHVTAELDRSCLTAPSAVKRLLTEWTGCEDVEVTGGRDG